ncbi:MAG: stage II sporulation protein M [Nanoarchaeota archaeon]
MKKQRNYLRESGKSIKLVITIFVASILTGLLLANYLSAFINPLLKDLIDQTTDLSTLELIMFIFFNNVSTSLIGLALGLFLGIFPIIVAVTNGVILGYVLERTAQISILEFWRLLPHGIFELPAVFISLGMGLKLGIDSIKNYNLVHKKNNKMQVLGIISVFLALIGIIMLKSTTAIVSDQNNALSSISTITLSLISLLFILPFILLFFTLNKKIRAYNLDNIYSALKVFLKLIVPLLVIAAVIEGLLIGVI